MQIIINAILTPILIMFFLFLFIEIIFFFVNIFLYKSPLNKDINLIKNLIEDNEKEFTNSLSNLIKKKFLDFQVDLLLLRQHLSFIIDNNDRILINKSNQFYNSFIKEENCKFNNIYLFNNKSSFIEKIIKDDNDINKLLNNNDLNVIYYNSTKNNDDNEDDRPMICYALLYLKSKLIQNILNQGYELEIINTQIYFNDNLYIYPSVDISINEEIKNYEKLNYFNFYISSPKFHKNNIYQQICTLIKIYINNDEKNMTICNTIDLMKIFNKSYINSTNFIFNILYFNESDDDNQIKLIYNSNDIINLIFNNYSNIFNETNYTIDNSTNQLQLFHSLYYEIFLNYDNNMKIKKEDLENEYDNITKKLNQSLLNDEEKENLTLKKYYLEYKFNNKGQKIKKSLSQSNFYFILTPLNITYEKFDENKNIFIKDSNNENNFKFYFLSVIKEKNPRFSNDIYKIYVFKSLRFLFFFIAILILMFVIFFIIIQFIMNFLLNPIKFYQNNIEKLLDIKNDLNSNNDNSKMDFENFKKFLYEHNKQFIQNKNFLNKILSNQYTNLEMKELENVISFLQKILLIRNPKIPFQQKIEFYQSISNEIPQNLKLELYKCQIIIAQLYIKDKKFLNAKNELENLQKKIENEINEIKNKSDYNELKNRNLLNNSNHYLNEYVFNENFIINNSDNNIINLKFIEQNYNYLLGLLNYYLFHEIKKRNKKNKTKKKFTFKTSFYYKNNNLETNKMDFYLENAINHLKKSYKINSHLEINLIKNIYIKILLAKCYNSFSIRKNEETNKNLKKSILVLNKFNDLIKKLKNNNNIIVDSRIMLIINGIYFELILFNIGKFSVKIRKYKIAYICFFKLLSISNFKNQKIHFKALKWLEKLNNKINDENIQFKEKSISKNYLNILKENLNKYFNEIKNKQEKKDEKILINEILNFLQKNYFSSSDDKNKLDTKIYLDSINNLFNKQKFSKINLILNSILSYSEIKKNILLISKMKNRIDLKQSLLKKCVIFIISESFSYNFNALKSFNLLLLNCLNKYLIGDDKIGFIFYDENGCSKILYLKEKKYNLEKFLEMLKNISKNENFNIFYKKNSFYLTNSFEFAIDLFLQCDNFNDYDKYIFTFGKIKDIRFKYKEKAKEIINKINYLNISFYYFAFNSYKEIDDLEHYYKFFQNFIEGILIIVENFKLIKSVFANFTFRGNQKNLLNINIDNENNI